MARSIIAVMALLFSVLISGCSESQPELVTDQLLQGEVSYRAKILIPPGSQLVIKIRDQQQREMGVVEQEIQGAPPFAFELPYASADSLTIDIKIMIDGEVKFSAPAQPLDTKQKAFWL